MRPGDRDRLRLGAVMALLADAGHNITLDPLTARQLGRRDLSWDARPAIVPAIDGPAVVPPMAFCDQCGDLVDAEEAIFLNNIGTACSDGCASQLERANRPDGRGASNG